MKTNISLLPHNTFGIEARAAYFCEYESLVQLTDAIHHIHSHLHNHDILHIGGGSNLLLLGDFPGVVLHSRIVDIEEIPSGADGEVMLRVGAGMVWDDLVAHCVSQGWYGLENLSLIPGEVGASAVQNIGAYGAEAKDFIHEVECVSLLTGEMRIFTWQDCCYGYRQSIFKNQLKGQYAVTHVTFQLSRNFRPNLEYGGIRQALQKRGISESNLTAQQLRETIISIRQEKLPDPKIQGNAGSFFMNPIIGRDQYQQLLKRYPAMPHYEVDEHHVKVPAGWLIEQAGWKGRSLGPAAVHDRQALVLVNLGGAKGQDIVRLCQSVQADVQSQFGVQLHPEVNFISGC